MQLCRAQAQPRVDLEAAGSSGVVSDTLFLISICLVVDCWTSITFGIRVNDFLILVLSTTLNITTPNIRMTPLTQVGGVVSVLVVIAIIVLVGALVHR